MSELNISPANEVATTTAPHYVADKAVATPLRLLLLRGDLPLRYRTHRCVL